IIKNDDAKAMFVNTMLDLLNTDFSTENITLKIDELTNTIAGEMPTSIKRWENVNSMEQWYENLDVLYEFAEKRPEIIKNHLIRRLHLENVRYVDLTV